MNTRLVRYFGFIALLSVSSLLITACDEDETQESPGFDRSILLEDIATNLIVPNFESLQTSVQSLASATSTFNQNTTEANLATLRQTWVQAVTDYQHCSAFGFGPASLPLGPFSTVIGVFPVDESQVEQNIQNPSFNLAASFDRDVRGFFTVEYLIYGTGQTDAEIAANFSEERKAYLQLIVDELEQTLNTIVAEWNSTYFTEFTTNDGTSAGSPISLLYNEFVKDYENLKNFKIELPAGLTAGQTSANPQLVEAYYSGISKDLIAEHFENTKNIWFGRSRNGQAFTSFEEYLNSVVEGPALVSTTIDAIGNIDVAINAIPQGKFSDNVERQELITLRDELQSNTANFKSSMSSLLGISITFNSGDGD